jgi:hypothetical protein
MISLRKQKRNFSSIVDRITKIVVLSALCIALILAPSGTAAASHVSVTIVIGGAACGVYFVLAYTVDYLPDWKPFQMETAVLNHSPEGWRVECPRLKFVKDGCSSYAPYIEIISVRF